METIEPYNKEITYTELSDYITKTFCMPKLFRDSDKPDPMTESIHDLVKMLREEQAEMMQAFWKWECNKTDKNANALLEEIADNINICVFLGGQVAGFQRMRRE